VIQQRIWIIHVSQYPCTPSGRSQCALYPYFYLQMQFCFVTFSDSSWTNL